MRYIVDNDLHIHSKISACSADDAQTKERILKYAIDNGLKTICLTDHFWDDAVEGANGWYAQQNYAHIRKALPLPQKEGIKFLFGCETELGGSLQLALSKEKYDLFDFIVIPTTHFHMSLTPEDAVNAKSRALAWIKRFDAVLNMDLPFKKVGIAHLTCPLIARDREEYLEVLKLLPIDEMERLFNKAAEVGAGIELNATDMNFSPDEADVILRPYRVAIKCGCKFYLGSDAHHPEKFEVAKNIFERAVELLDLKEEHKFTLQERS